MGNLEIRHNQLQTTNLGMQLPDGNLTRIGSRVELFSTTEGAQSALAVVHAIDEREVARAEGIVSPHIGGSREAESILFMSALKAVQRHYEQTGEVPIITEGSPIIRVKALPERTIVKPAAIKK